MLDGLDEWICGMDEKGEVIYINAALASAIGQIPRALTGMPFVDLLPLGAREAAMAAIQKALSSGQPQTYQHGTNTESGDGVWCQWTIRKMNDRNSRGEGVSWLLAIGRDITEQKRLEHQFQHAQRIGSIGMLTNGIAHDLNNVLAPIVMSVDLLKLRNCTDENRALLEVMATSAERGSSLISQMLSISRGLDGDHEVVDLGSMVKELGRFIVRTFGKNIRVSIDLAPDLERLSANPTQIYQVLLNLCVNARDAMPHGGQLKLSASNVTLDAAAAAAKHPGAVPGTYAVLGVADTGTGIPPAIVNRIFDPFFTTKPVGEGTGLGLSTVQSIVKSCGGFITLSTSVGRGTEFRVHFPAHLTSVESSSSAPTMEAPRGTGQHVLIVDDEEHLCKVTRHLLESFGYTAHIAIDGARAIQFLERHKSQVEAAIIDLNMPVMDGRTTMTALRAINPGIRIITVSGSGEDVDDLLADASIRHLTKPYSLGTLLQAVSDAFARPGPAGAAPISADPAS